MTPEKQCPRCGADCLEGYDYRGQVILYDMDGKPHKCPAVGEKR